MKVLPDGSKVTCCEECDEMMFDSEHCWCNITKQYVSAFSIDTDCPLPDAEVGEE